MLTCAHGGRKVGRYFPRFLDTQAARRIRVISCSPRSRILCYDGFKLLRKFSSCFEHSFSATDLQVQIRELGRRARATDETARCRSELVRPSPTDKVVLCRGAHRRRTHEPQRHHRNPQTTTSWPTRTAARRNDATLACLT
eukprot:6206175-Pleurochrysis_carterae.AAC.2